MDDPAPSKNLALYFALIWGLYMVLSGIYIFDKGLPQPADIILLAGLLPGLIWQFLQSNGKLSTLYMIGGGFALLTLIINLTQFVFLPDSRFLLSALYYPYNFLVFCFVVFLMRQNPAHFIRLTSIALIIAVLLQALWAGLFDGGTLRATGGFQNPNQLAYWSLLSAGILFFLRRDHSFSWLDFGIFLVLIYIQSLSLSKAGLISSFVLLGVIFLSRQIRISMKLSLMGLGLTGAIVALISTDISVQIETLSRVIERLSTLGLERDDSLMGRGYDRLWEHPHFLILGAGEGGFSRFVNAGGARELHSGLATILFSYGIIGFGLFSAFLIKIFSRQPLICWAILGCILLFSLPHQAFRFTHFWVFLGIAYGSFITRRNA